MLPGLPSCRAGYTEARRGMLGLPHYARGSAPNPFSSFFCMRD